MSMWLRRGVRWGTRGIAALALILAAIVVWNEVQRRLVVLQYREIIADEVAFAALRDSVLAAWGGEVADTVSRGVPGYAVPETGREQVILDMLARHGEIPPDARFDAIVRFTYDSAEPRVVLYRYENCIRSGCDGDESRISPSTRLDWRDHFDTDRALTRERLVRHDYLYFEGSTELNANVFANASGIASRFCISIFQTPWTSVQRAIAAFEQKAAPYAKITHQTCEFLPTRQVAETH